MALSMWHNLSNTKKRIIIICAVIILFSIVVLIMASIKKDTPLEKTEAELMQEAHAKIPEFVYQIVPENSVISWKASSPVVSRNGELKIRSGELTVRDNILVSGNIVVDMNSITESENDSELVEQLKGVDFFQVNKYPTAQLSITEITWPKAKIDYDLMAKGLLTIVGKKNPVSFPLKFVMKNGMINAETDFRIDRTRWGIVYNSGKFFDDLGDAMIKDDIQLSVHLVAIKN